MKALELLYKYQQADEIAGGYLSKSLEEAIKELERLQAKYENLNEYYWFARNHLESYRCKCGTLGRVGYLCSNKECTEV